MHQQQMEKKFSEELPVQSNARPRKHYVRSLRRRWHRSFRLLKLRRFKHHHSLSLDSQTQNTSLQRLQNVEKRVVRVLELAGGVMDELASPTGPRKEFINNDCREFMQLIKDIQVTLREEIKSACEYRPFEKCDYRSRISNEICCKKLEYVMLQLDGMKRTIDEYYQVEV
ncbi:mediator of RNA polymerase II transcription subunit 11-like [Tripterygium wilfordii]|uniref:mediator of RNA polymerase II transcription subunit 11-like n=1 Tax=Tripterygium wilfordii TaxID=458696 RepID=UPI0018F7F221|nr:mediator of RNA polymerase II transcription subunit 11-like [Tripterygium wilfordii]